MEQIAIGFSAVDLNPYAVSPFSSARLSI